MACRFHHEPLTLEAESYLESIVDIFVGNLKSDCIECVDCIYRPTQSNVTVKLNALQSDLTLSWATDESYTLDIRTEEDGEHRVGNLITDATVTVHINATNLFGIRHGLETLSQLIAYTSYEDRYVIWFDMLVIILFHKNNDMVLVTWRSLSILPKWPIGQSFRTEVFSWTPPETSCR